MVCIRSASLASVIVGAAAAAISSSAAALPTMPNNMIPAQEQVGVNMQDYKLQNLGSRHQPLHSSAPSSKNSKSGKSKGKSGKGKSEGKVETVPDAVSSTKQKVEKGKKTSREVRLGRRGPLRQVTGVIEVDLGDNGVNQNEEEPQGDNDTPTEDGGDDSDGNTPSRRDVRDYLYSKRHSGSDTVVVDNGRHGDDTTVTEIDPHRHHDGVTVVHKRALLDIGYDNPTDEDGTILSVGNNDPYTRPLISIGTTYGDSFERRRKLASLGRAFLGRNRHSSSPASFTTRDVTFDQNPSNNGQHDEVTIDKRHSDKGTTVVDTDRHGKTVVVDNDHHRGSDVVVNKRHSGNDVTVVEGKHHHGTTVVVDKHGKTLVVTRDHQVRHDGKVVVVDDGRDHHHHHDGSTVVTTRAHNDEEARSILDERDHRHHHDDGHDGDVVVVNGDRKHGSTVVTSRHHDDKVVVVDGDRHHHDGSTVITSRHSNHDHDGDAVVVDNDRHHGSTVVENAKRDTPTLNIGGAPGYIDVTSIQGNSTTPSRIASLVLSTSNITDTNSTFVLNASNNIRTQVYLVPINSTDTTSTNSSSPDPIVVNLKLPIFVASSASMQPYCATFDPSPQNPAPLTVMPCINGTTNHESQRFLYDPSTGVIQPDWTPSEASQQLLQSVPDSIDDAEDDITSSTIPVVTVMNSVTKVITKTMSIPAPTVVLNVIPTETITPPVNLILSSPTLPKPSSILSSGIRRRSYPVTPTSISSSDSNADAMTASTTTSISEPTSTPSSSISDSASASSPTASSSSIPDLDSNGPSESTDSTPYSTASNVTLIFTPSTGSVTTDQAYNPVVPDSEEGSTMNSNGGSQGAQSFAQIGLRSDN